MCGQPAELARQVPVLVAEQLHRGREQDRPDQRGVDEDRHGEADAELLDTIDESVAKIANTATITIAALVTVEAVERMPCDTASSVLMPRS